MIFTQGEMEAARLLKIPALDTQDTRTPHDAGNEIIRLAERIKAERAVATMEQGEKDDGPP